MSHDEKKLRKKLELIERLLAKAESTTPAEAEALTAAAFKLMSQYGIDQATVDAARRAADKIRSIRAEAVKESEPGTDLVLVSRRARVDEHLESLGYATARPRQWSNGLAASSGRAADREANLGQGEIVHRRALI